MIPGTLARRYARALMDLAQSPTERDAFADDLDAFADLTRQKDDAGAPLVVTLTADRFLLSQRAKLVEALATRLSVAPMVLRFVHYVLERGRMDGITQIARASRRMADDLANRVRAKITTARPLSADATGRLVEALERATGRTVISSSHVNPEIIGGVVAQVGSYVLDGSVPSTLAAIRASLRGQ
jgi:F-type H+-transporting ATPase subunit delta